MADALPLTARFRRALVFAARVHARQFRKGTRRPYIGHLLGVTSIVLTHGGDEDEAIAALLHDAVEDPGGKRRLREIGRKFGARVAGLAKGCTDSDVQPKPPWNGKRNTCAICGMRMRLGV
jgi:(p)ppGpp synthase/HD superfamily hydrolase